MDLREKTSVSMLRKLKELAIEGLLNYQPFIFSDDFEIGVGYEFEQGVYSGLVYHPHIESERLQSPQLRRILVDPERYEAFHAANRRLALYYDHCAERILEAVGDPSRLTFLDVGCNIGYIPQRFALYGAKMAAGCDRQDFSRSFSALNGILGTDTRFLHQWYEPSKHVIDGMDCFDVVTSMAMICHVSDPMHLMSELGKLARKALFIWTIVNDDQIMTCHYGEPRGDYGSDGFPYCFDNMVCPSVPLIRRAMEMMGFGKCVEYIPRRVIPDMLGETIPFVDF